MCTSLCKNIPFGNILSHVQKYFPNGIILPSSHLLSRTLAERAYALPLNPCPANEPHRRKSPSLLRAARGFAVGAASRGFTERGLSACCYSTPTMTSVDFTMASAASPSARPSCSMASLVMEPLMRLPSAVSRVTWPLTAPSFTSTTVPAI